MTPMKMSVALSFLSAPLIFASLAGAADHGQAASGDGGVFQRIQQSQSRLLLGQSVKLGQGKAYAWVQVGAKGNPERVGVTLSDGALSGLPKQMLARDLDLPDVEGMPFDHVGLDWAPHGHEPPGVYDLPHFDVHFYHISPADRARITLAGDDLDRARKEPSPEFIPAGYVSSGQAVPGMGMHWIDPKSPELNGQVFTHTFIYGFHDGTMNFHEVMLTRDFLKRRQDVVRPLAMPERFSKAGSYPDAYAVRYDAVRGETDITLEKLSPR